MTEPDSKVRRNYSKNSKKSKPLIKENTSIKKQMTVIESKRGKTKFTEEQLSILKDFYSQNPYPNLEQRKSLSDRINCLEKRVNIWFQNTRRAKKKSDSLVNSICSTVSTSSNEENSTFPHSFDGKISKEQTSDK